MLNAAVMVFQDYPRLTREEFSEACHHLDSRYRQATLGPLRRNWRLGVYTALDMSVEEDDVACTFLQISRPLEAVVDHEDLSLDIGKFTLDESRRGQELVEDREMADREMADAEDADEVMAIVFLSFHVHIRTPTYSH